MIWGLGCSVRGIRLEVSEKQLKLYLSLAMIRFQKACGFHQATDRKPYLNPAYMESHAAPLEQTVIFIRPFWGSMPVVFGV